jgi:hypothetical protein
MREVLGLALDACQGRRDQVAEQLVDSRAVGDSGGQRRAMRSYALTSVRVDRSRQSLTISNGPGGDEALIQITGRQNRLLGARIAGLMDTLQ